MASKQFPHNVGNLILSGKFLVGFEMFGEAQRDLTPESATEKLRAAGWQRFNLIIDRK
ncbi:hypothetical protein PGTUg99_024755 [Puccinia graminis f. sp. tritici]|uniref:Uncharacterized protein n=1 Tax=Puccinia graminis f. sp. tritici TaxID=56615 RepID=A0A5B0NFA0_PUCGR|nr:hypothetical protein PGTUg99_024755 [Puccinia graminis f. sp. tritici]